MTVAAAALGDGPGIAGEPAVLGGGGAAEPQVLGPVQRQCLVDMAAGIDKGALRPLPGQREYLGLVAQLYVAAAAGQHAALAQEAQLCSEALNRTVNTAQQSRIVSERILFFLNQIICFTSSSSVSDPDLF